MEEFYKKRVVYSLLFVYNVEGTQDVYFEKNGGEKK